MELRLPRRRGAETQTLRGSAASVRALLQSETASAVILAGVVVAALVWANLGSSYGHTWGTTLAVRLGEHETAHSLRSWVNSGLMTLFFVVVGLEARRELDLGELRDRRRLMTPVVTGLLAMLLPVLLYLLLAGRTGAGGWGVAMSTDTAFALGSMTLFGGGASDRLRVFLLTVLVVDDVVSVGVVAVVYSDRILWSHVLVALVFFILFALSLRAGIDLPLLYALMGLAVWGALLDSGIDPIGAGLAIGLLATAYSPRTDNLARATRTFRIFREEPTAESAQSARLAVSATQSPNSRLQRFYVPWTSYLIVPLFGLANAGVVLDPSALRSAASSPVTWGIVVGLLLGKPLGYAMASEALRLASRGRAAAPVGRAGLAVVGTAAAAPFTLSLLIADLAFRGKQLNDAKAGVLLALAVSFLLGGGLLALVRRMPGPRRARALQGDGYALTDLQAPVDDDLDHWRGAVDADVTIVEYGDFECPHCGRAEEAALDELSSDSGVRYVWRHLPLTDVHPHAQLAAEASEAAAAQGRFWEMHDVLLSHQDDLTWADLVRYAGELGLDTDRFAAEVKGGRHRERVEGDAERATVNDVAGTPTFFINGKRHYGDYDFPTIRAGVREARDRLVAVRGR